MKIKQLIAVFIGATTFGASIMYSTSKPIVTYADATAAANNSNNNDDNDDNTNGQGDREPGVIGGNDQGGAIGGDAGAGGAATGGTTAGATATSGVGAGTTATNPQRPGLYGQSSNQIGNKPDTSAVSAGRSATSDNEKNNNDNSGRVNGDLVKSFEIKNKDIRISGTDFYVNREELDSKRFSSALDKKSPNFKVSISNANKKWYQLDRQISKVNNSDMSASSKKKYISGLLKKYDGAESDITITDTVKSHGKKIRKSYKFKEKLVKGGLNDFAKSKSGLEELRTYYGKIYVTIVSGGTVAGAVLGGLPGAVVGGLSTSLAGHRFDDAQKDVKKMINKGRRKGGCRITLTDEFPIKSLKSTKQARI